MSDFVSTDSVSEGHRLNYWNELVRLNCSSVEVQPLLDIPFFGSISTDHLGFVKFTEITAHPSLVTPSKQFLDQPNEDCFRVIYQLVGETIIYHQDRAVHLRTGDWVFLDSIYTHDLKHTLAHEKHVILVLQLPRSAFSTRLPNPELLTGYAINGSVGLGRVTYDFVQSLRRDLAYIEADAKLQLAEILVDMLAVNLRETLCPARSIPRNRAVLLLAAKTYIHRRLDDPALSVAMIAKALNISKSYLYLLFRGENTTVNRYIWDLRLEKCRAVLANPLYNHRSISEIAFSYGFSNMSHFSRLFKECYGLAPRNYRHQ